MGWSLWLIPLENSPFTRTARELIDDTVPRNFQTPEKIQRFDPHVTITSDIDFEKIANGKSPKEWLDQLELPNFRAEHDEVLLELDTVEAEDPFFRKMNVALKDNDNLKKLAAVCREKGVGVNQGKAQEWAQKEYRPHMSLFYGDVPTQDVKSKVPLIEMKIGFA
jgi:2',3'-cyclic-nucleotide 3'-phosphodiesterase